MSIFKFLFLLIFFFQLATSGCCCKKDDVEVCNYSKKDVRFLNNTAKVLEVEVTYFNVNQSFVEVIRPFEGKWYKNDYALLSSSTVSVSIDQMRVKTFNVDPCAENLVLVYEE